MRRFEDDNEEYEDTNGGEAFPDDFSQKFSEDGFPDFFQKNELRSMLLDKSLALCEKSLFWRFRSLQTKINMLASVYATLISLLDPDAE